MPKPGQYDIEVTTGDDYELTIAFEDEAGQPLNMSGRAYEASYRQGYDEPWLVIFTVDNAGLGSGLLVLSLSSTQTAALRGMGSWRLRETYNSKTHTILEGALTGDT